MKTRPSARSASILAIAGMAVLTSPALAQDEPPAARAADVASLEAIVLAIYDVISGPAGQARDWDRFRSLFVSGARLIPTFRSADGTTGFRVLTPQDYIEANASALTRTGFREHELARRVETFGNIAHVFSTYESAFTTDGQDRSARGINSLQLYNDGRRWWIVSILWDSERPDNPIPARYLGEA